MKHFSRLAAVLREAAEICDEIACEQSRRPRPQRPNQDAAATEAVRKVRAGLRRNGVKHVAS